MDLLAGYGSDAGESDDGSPQPVQQERPVAAPGASPAREPPAAEPGKLLAGLPPPSTVQRPLFSGLPKPATRQTRKIVARFRVPIDFGPAPDVAPGSSDEEGPAKKRARSTRGLSLRDLLPAPTQEGGQHLDLGADEDDDIVPGTEDHTGMELGPGGADVGEGDAEAEVQPAGNEAYRVAPQPPPAQQPVQHGSAAHYGAAQYAAALYGAAPYAAHYGAQQYAASGPSRGHGAPAPAAAPASPGVDLLDEALAAERARAARRGAPDPLAASGVQFKEIRADSIRASDAGARAAADSARTALGAGYEARLRREAGPDPSKLARRKHQIGSLYHSAKLQELEALEKRTSGMKSKAETQRKYGW